MPKIKEELSELQYIKEEFYELPSIKGVLWTAIQFSSRPKRDLLWALLKVSRPKQVLTQGVVEVLTTFSIYANNVVATSLRLPVN